MLHKDVIVKTSEFKMLNVRGVYLLLQIKCINALDAVFESQDAIEIHLLNKILNQKYCITIINKII